MIARIFRKDCRLLWPVALGVGAVNAVLRFILLRAGLFPDFRMGSLLNLLIVGGLFGSAVLVILAVQLDSLPGLRQDWLIRPIPRSHLFWSKFLFLVLVAQGPIFAAELLQGLAAGFPFTQAFAASLQRSLWLIAMLGLPAIAFATLTRNLMEAVFAGLICFLAGVVAVSTLNLYAVPQPTMDSGVEWITNSAMALAAVLGAAAVIALQYRRRKTPQARWVFAGAGALWLTLLFTPWRPAFALEKRLSPSPGASSAVSIAFDPASQPFQPPAGASLKTALRNARGVAFASLYLPVRVSGVSPSSLLLVDAASVRLTAPNGDSTLAHGAELQARPPAPVSFELVQVPAAWLAVHQNEPVRAEIDFSLTLARLASEHFIPAANGELRAPDSGWCQTRVNDSATAVLLRCMRPGYQSDAATFTLENPASGAANPVRTLFAPNYSLYFRAFEPDSMSRRGVALPFRDPSGMARFPVSGADLAHARVHIRSYTAADHFSRTLSIPSLRLAAWAVNSD